MRGRSAMSATVLPVVDPGETITTMTNRVSAVPLRDTGWRWWWMALAPSVALLAFGMVGVGWAFLRGIRVWGNDWPVMWGFPILAYVWWIAIASGGTFVSAFFFLVRVEWRTSVNRIAETMTLFAAISAGVYPILHLGRPYFAYWLFPYPNTMTLWPQWKSPLLWDFMALLTYVVASILFWYLGLLPDLATDAGPRAHAAGPDRLWDIRHGLSRLPGRNGVTSRRPTARSPRSWRRWWCRCIPWSGWISPAPLRRVGTRPSTRPSSCSVRFGRGCPPSP